MDTQPEPTLIELIRYNNWANAQVFATCLKLSPEHLAASAPGAYGSIHATLGHMIAAEADYIHRLTGKGPQPPFRWEDAPALEFARHVGGCAPAGDAPNRLKTAGAGSA